MATSEADSTRPEEGGSTGDLLLSSLHLLRDGLATAGSLFLFLVMFAIGGGLYAVAPFLAAENWPTWAVVALFPIFVAVLGVALFLLFDERQRRKLFLNFIRDGPLGWLNPIIVAALVFVFALAVFSVATFLLLDWKAVSLAVPSCEQCQVELGQLSNFYIWHFLGAVPLLDINESLQWSAPLTYSGALAGWLVIAFKAAVIVPLFQAIRAYLEVRKEIPRIRVRPWAWPRVTRPGTAVTVNWASSAPPAGYLFDVKLEHSHRQASQDKQGSGTKSTETRWLTDTDRTSEKYTPETPGVYRFRATWHEAWGEGLAEERREKLRLIAEHFVLSRPVKVVVRPHRHVSRGRS